VSFNLQLRKHMIPTDVINTMKNIIGRGRSWEKEVRFNSLVDCGSNLLFFGNSHNIFALEETPGDQYLMPKGLVEITGVLLGKQSSDEDKIKLIKEILINKGYDGQHEGSSWKRTEKTNKVYKQLADLITYYEKPDERPFFYLGK
jgi:hypothetical protein